MEGSDRPPANVWAAASPRPGAPVPAAPAYLTYVDSDSVGFDIRLALPAVCLKCGTTDALEPVPLKIKIQGDLLARASFAAQGSARYGATVRPGDRVELNLPICRACLARQRLAQRYTLAAALAPFWIALLAIAGNAISSSLVAVAILGGLAAAAVLGVIGFSRRTSAAVRFERIDGDGILRLGGIHPDASEAIVAAAAPPPAT